MKKQTTDKKYQKDVRKKYDQRLFTFDFASKVVKWLCLSANADSPSIPLCLLTDVCTKLSRILHNRGIKFTLVYVKATRGNFYNYLSGNPLRIPGSPCFGVSQFPSILGPLKADVDKCNYPVIRLITTILSATRAIKLKMPVDVSSITQPNRDVPDISKHMLSFWQIMGYKCPAPLPKKLSKVDMVNYRLSRGPNGHALLASNYESDLLPMKLKVSLEVISRGIGYFISTVSNSNWLLFQSFLGNPVEKPRGLIRKNTSFPDKEGKMRTIGILDYWSQLALKPIHTYLGNFLSKIRQDCTLDQSKFFNLLKDSRVFYSVDLTSATDRFPIKVISQLLKIRLPANYVQAWEDVMVGYPFEHEGHKLIYGTGTPMGAYTSFNSFALTHHYIIYYCCKELGIVWKTLPYALLGDDIVLGNKEVAEMYMKVIKSLHVDYSPAKTHKSDRFYEFAKRIIYNGIEISPFPISSLKASSKSSDVLVLAIRESSKRGFDFHDVSLSVQIYFSLVKEFRSKLCKKISKNSYYFSRVLDCTEGIVPAVDVFNDILGKNNLPDKHFKAWMKPEKVLDIAILSLYKNNIIETLKVISGKKGSPLLESNNLVKSYVAFCDDQEKSKPGSAPHKSSVYFAPFYWAVYALKEELRNEQKTVLERIDNTTLSVSKNTIKSRVNKTKIGDLLTVERDKKKIANTARELFKILEREIINEYWRTYDPSMGFSAAGQATAARKLIKEISNFK